MTIESKMSEVGLQVLDGSRIKSALPELKTKESFTKHDEGSKGYLTSSEVRRAAEAEAAALLLGVRLSAQILDNAISKLPMEDSAKVTEEAFATTLRSYLTAIADTLDGTFESWSRYCVVCQRMQLRSSVKLLYIDMIRQLVELQRL